MPEMPVHTIGFAIFKRVTEIDPSISAEEFIAAMNNARFRAKRMADECPCGRGPLCALRIAQFLFEMAVSEKG